MTPNGRAVDPVVKVDARTEIEDKIRALVDDLSDIERAVLYFYLHASGWTITKAQLVKGGWKP